MQLLQIRYPIKVLGDDDKYKQELEGYEIITRSSMAFLVIYFVRKEYPYDLEKGHGE